MEKSEFSNAEIAPIPDIPEELIAPINALLNTARMYQGIIAEAIKGTTSIHKSILIHPIDIADNVMASWNKKLPPKSS